MKSIIITDPKGVIRKMKSIAEAAKFMDVSQQTMRNWMEGKTQPDDGWKIKVFEEEGDEYGGLLGITGMDFDPKTNKLLVTSRNIGLALMENGYDFGYNELTDNLEINGNPIDDITVDLMCVRLDPIGLNNEKKVRQVISDLCMANSYNPLKQMIEEFEWDGEKRAESFFIDFLGAKDTGLNRKYTRNWFKGAMKRLYDPGCAFDNMVILYDRTHGTGKTKIFERLALGYSVINPEISNKDCINVMNRAWIVNFDELARFDKKSMEELKTFITTRTDTNRLAYARHAKEYRRHCVLCGTTNDQFFLRDYTDPKESERRFWIMNCEGKRRSEGWWREMLPDSYIGQVWAEVKTWYDEDPELEDFTLEEKDEEFLIQSGHKSFLNDQDTIQTVRSILNGKYSKKGMEDYRTFKKEALSPEVKDVQVLDFDMVDVGWIAGALKRTNDYIAAIVIGEPGWVIRDGKIIRVGPDPEIQF